MENTNIIGWDGLNNQNVTISNSDILEYKVSKDSKINLDNRVFDVKTTDLITFNTLTKEIKINNIIQ